MDPRSPFPRTAEEGDYFGVSAERRSLHWVMAGLSHSKLVWRALPAIHVFFLSTRIRRGCLGTSPAMTIEGHSNPHASARLFDDCSAREETPATTLGASAVRRPASDMALDAFCAIMVGVLHLLAERLGLVRQHLRLPGEELALALRDLLRFLRARELLPDSMVFASVFSVSVVACSRMAQAWFSKSSAILRLTLSRELNACLLWVKPSSANSRAHVMPNVAACIARSPLSRANSRISCHNPLLFWPLFASMSLRVPGASFFMSGCGHSLVATAASLPCSCNFERYRCTRRNTAGALRDQALGAPGPYSRL